MPDLDSNSLRALAACSVWLRVGFIGTTALAVGLIRLFDGEAGSLALAFFGATLAIASWRRAFTVLEHAERASGAGLYVPAEPSARFPETGRTRRDPKAFRYSAATRQGAR